MNIRQRFRQSLKNGTGEAVIILKQNRGLDFSRDIEKAILNNYAYDTQLEDERSFYLWQLIELSDKKEHLVEIAIKALGRMKEDNPAIDQLFGLARIYAKQGNIKAKQAIYKRYSRGTIDGEFCLGEEEILELDWIEGLKYIAEVRGKALTKKSKYRESGFLADIFQKNHPKINVYYELRTAAESNPFIKKYLDAIEWTKPTKREKRKINYEFVKDKIENTNRYPAPGFIRRLTKTDIKKLADDFLNEKDLFKKGKYLSVFSETKYPYDYHQILPFAKGKRNRKNRLVEFACQALSFFKASDIRKLVIEKLLKTNAPAYYLPLLVSNYKKGDYNLLSKIAEKYKNENIVHDLVWGYVDIYTANKTKECKRPLEIMYRKMNCYSHRYDIVKILYDNGVLSSKMLKELEFDSSEEIRDFYKQIC